MARGAPDRRHLSQIGTADWKPVKKSGAGVAYDVLGSQVGGGGGQQSQVRGLRAVSPEMT